MAVSSLQFHNLHDQSAEQVKNKSDTNGLHLTLYIGPE
jgi:hypothetical protein